MDFDNNENDSKKPTAVIPPFNAGANEEHASGANISEEHASDSGSNEEFEDSAQSEGSEEPAEPTVQELKWRLRTDHRQEIRNFHEISDLTRSIANTFQHDKKNRLLAHNLNHELRLRSTIDHNVKLLRNSDSSTEINTALDDVHERKDCFDEQHNFINEAVSYGQMDVLFPDQLLNMSFERQRILFKHIFKNNYPSHASISFCYPNIAGGFEFIDLTIHRMPKAADSVQNKNANPIRLLDEAGPQPIVLQEFYEFEGRSPFDSSDSSETGQLPALVPAERAIDTNEATAAQSSVEQSSQEAGAEISSTGLTLTHSPEDSAVQDTHTINPASSSLPEQISQQDEREFSQEGTEDTALFSGVERSFLSPGCSKWTRPHCSP